MIPLALLFGQIAPPQVPACAMVRTIELLGANQPTGKECEAPPNIRARGRRAIENHARVIAYLREHGAAKRTTMCADLGISEDQARLALERLKADGIVTLEGAGQAYVWRITAKGRADVCQLAYQRGLEDGAKGDAGNTEEEQKA